MPVLSPGYVQRSQIAGVIGYRNIQFYMIISNCVPDWLCQFILPPAVLKRSFDISTFGNIDTNICESNGIKYNLS